MSEIRFNLTNSAGSVPGQPSQPQPPKGVKPSWDNYPLVEGLDQWRYVRRSEILNLSVPFIVAQIRPQDPQDAEANLWRSGEQSADDRDREIVQRAVRLATLLQSEVDRARPRV